MNLSISYLERIQKSEKLRPVTKKLIGILLEAINDWPSPIKSLADYEKEVYELIREDVNRKTLERYISKIDYSKNAWEAESLSQLLEVFNYFEEEKTLKEIFKKIQKQTQQNML
ncbi:MAG: hypothetical protein H7A32_06195 [Deltaproteobacteria bacterium]|nr:hypothetical protein [Deltaproteobacteria bacterium]